MPLQSTSQFDVTRQLLALPRRSHREGNILVLLTVMIPVLLILASYLINLAYIEAAKLELQLVADAAAQSATSVYMKTGSREDALAEAQQAAARNPINGYVLGLGMNDLEFGIGLRPSLQDEYSFNPVGTGVQGNAVRVTTKSLNQGSVPSPQPVFPTFSMIPTIRPIVTATSTQGAMDIALVIDRSGSMAFASDEVAAEGVSPAAAPLGWAFGDPVPPQSRWLDVVAAVQTFVNYLNSSPGLEWASLSTYSTDSSTELLLTENLDQVVPALGQTSAQFNGGGTSIGLGMQEGLAALTDPTLSRKFAVQVMILLTDGIHNYGASPDQAANQLRNRGVTLFTITFSNEADQTRMKNLATSCGGEHFHAVDAVGLQAAFDDISRSLPILMTQ